MWYSVKESSCILPVSWKLDRSWIQRELTIYLVEEILGQNNMQTMLWLLHIAFIKVYNERKQQEQKDMKTCTQGKK